MTNTRAHSERELEALSLLDIGGHPEPHGHADAGHDMSHEPHAADKAHDASTSHAPEKTHDADHAADKHEADTVHTAQKEHDANTGHVADTAHAETDHAADKHEADTVHNAQKEQDAKTGHQAEHDHGVQNGKADAHSDHGHKAHGDHGHAAAGDAHGHADHGGHADAHGGHGHEAHSTVATAVALMLLGMITFIMTLFYLVHFPFKMIQLQTWRMLSSTVSIFVAVLFFYATKAECKNFFGEKEGTAHHHTTKRTAIVAGLRFVLTFCIFQGGLIYMRRSETFFKPMAILGAHVVGFAAIEGFGDLLELSPFKDSLGMAILVLIFAIVVMAAFENITGKIRSSVTGGEEGSGEGGEEGGEEFEEVCQEADIEGGGLCSGLILSLLVRFAITGEMAILHGSPRGKERWQVEALVGAAVTLCILTMVMSKFHDAAHGMPRIFSGIQETLSMTTGWCFLYAGQWAFWRQTADGGVGEGDVMSAMMTMALVFSFIVIACMLVLSLFRDSHNQISRPVKSVMNSLALVLSLAWEATFQESIHNVAHLANSKSEQWTIEVGLSLLLVLVVAPGWAMYILPRTYTKEKEVA